MPNSNTRSHGANARQMEWEDESQNQGQKRGGQGWMPLDGIDDDLFSAGPQLRAMSAGPVAQAARTAEISMPWRRETKEERIAVTRPQPTVQRQVAQTMAQPMVKGNTQARGEKVVEARAVMVIAGGVALLVAAYAVISAAIDWTQVKMNDLQYGRPRTMQMDAYVGHSEVDGVPSHFVAMNLNRRITILEMPGGDSTKVNTIVGPYLFGQGEDLTPVSVSSTDLNGDGVADLLVSVKNEQLLYLNDGTAFRLATPEERLAIEKAASKPKVDANANANSASGEAGK
ncbi:MAG: FG-GAP repeat protein [Chloroflexia bacterium]